jgi:hypothetical protein
MSFVDEFMRRLPHPLRERFTSLNSPFDIQQYLDDMPYIADERDRSPMNVMLDNQSHCLDGGFFAALALWRLGFPPLVLDLVPDPGTDDDHVLALFRVNGRWGCAAKSNYVNLGFREPVHKSLRELAMTYFEHYCSYRQTKTLRGYTRPLDASNYTRLDWAWDETGANVLYHRYFYTRKPIPLITPEMAARLNPITDRVYAAETMYTNLGQAFGKRVK